MDYPAFPVPASVSAPAYIDPLLRFQTDSSTEIRRSRYSRPRRQFVLEYLGRSTHEMRIIRDFLASMRFGTLSFSWWHPTALESCTFTASTPIVLHYTMNHGLLTGQYVGVFESPAGNAANGFWQITSGGTGTILLNGSTSIGTGPGATRVYLPRAVARFSDDTYPSPARVNYGGGEGQAGTEQRWSWQVLIEEEI